MAHIEKRFGVVSIDDAAGTPVVITDDVCKVSGQIMRDIASYGGGLNNDHKRKMYGQRDGNLSVSFYVHKGTGGVGKAYRLMVAWLNGATPSERTVTVDFPATAVGNDRLSGEMLIKSVNPILDADDGSSEAVQVTIELEAQTPGLALTVQA